MEHTRRMRTARGRSAPNRLMVGLGLLLVPLVALWATGAANPFHVAARMRTENDALERQVRALQLQNQRAERELKAGRTSRGAVREARPLGWVMPQEQRLRIPE